MKKRHCLHTMLTAAVAALLLCTNAWAQGGTCAGMTPGQLSSLNGFVPFPSSNAWNTDISNALVDPNSNNIINFIGAGVTLQADFGSGTYRRSTIGIPYQVVAASQPKININIKEYAAESDPNPVPLPFGALIEGYPSPSGDRHVLVLDKDSCWLYELYNATFNKKTSGWSASSMAIWDMLAGSERPYTWTSADAAGLAVFPGLARVDEVLAGAINHALRFTVPITRRAFVEPASHWASTNTSFNAPPMGTRMRLRSTFDTNPYPPQARVILEAMKKYGIILADNGSGIFVSGAPDSRWNNDDLRTLKNVRASDFDVVQMGTIYTDSNVPTGAAPVISSFTAHPSSVSRGSLVTLSWTVTGASYNHISPVIGPVRGSAVMVAPNVSTTYTLTSTGRFGRTTKQVTVTVF
ncbi:MAG: hypothetical protein ACRD88_00595 [Terriglobia bacterium]